MYDFESSTSIKGVLVVRQSLTQGDTTVSLQCIGGTNTISGTNDGTNWTSLQIGASTYSIPQGGSGSSYTFTNGLTESSGTVSNDLFTKASTDIQGNNINFKLTYSSVVIGQNATRGGFGESVAIGSAAQATSQSVAIGSGARAFSAKSTAVGYQVVTSTTKAGQTVIGNKNATDNDSSFIFADGDNNPTNPNLAVIKTDGTIISKNLPDAPTTAGTYTLQVVVDAQGNKTYN